MGQPAGQTQRNTEQVMEPPGDEDPAVRDLCETYEASTRLYGQCNGSLTRPNSHSHL